MFDSSDIDGRVVKLILELIEVVVTVEELRVNNIGLGVKDAAS